MVIVLVSVVRLGPEYAQTRLDAGADGFTTLGFNMNIRSLGAAFALAATTTCVHAGVIQLGGTPAGAAGKTTNRAACTVDFNSGNTSNTCGAIYSGDPAGLTPVSASHFATGSAGGLYAAPAGDTSTYLTVGTAAGSPIYVNLATPANYFGFYAGSLDTFNLVEFFLAGKVVDSFNGTQINSVAFPGDPTMGNQSQAEFIDYFPGTFVAGSFVPALYDSIRITSAGNSFETDSHAFGIVPLVVPEPESIGLLGLGSIAMLASRRRRTRT